jgi:hypothetical protein
MSDVEYCVKGLAERLLLLEARMPRKEKGLVHYMRRREGGDVHVKITKKWEWMNYVEKLEHLLLKTFEGFALEIECGQYGMLKVSYRDLWFDFSVLDRQADFWFSNTFMKLRSTKELVDTSYKMFNERKIEWSNERIFPIVRLMLVCVVLYEIYNEILYVKAAIVFRKYWSYWELLPNELSYLRLRHDDVEKCLKMCMVYKNLRSERGRASLAKIIKENFREMMNIKENQSMDVWATTALERQYTDEDD